MEYSYAKKWELLMATVEYDRNSSEAKIQSRWESVCSDFLGYNSWIGEVESKKIERMGSLGREIPDIILRLEAKNIAVIELKKYNAGFRDEYEKQLFSYLNQFKCDLGVLVCDKIYLYDYDYYKSDENQVKCSIELDKENKYGIEFLKLFSKENFKREEIRNFINEVKKQNDMKKQCQFEKFVSLPNKIKKGNGSERKLILPPPDKIRINYVFEDYRNYKLLNYLLGLNYTGYQRASYATKENAMIWMVSLKNEVHNGWKNYMVGDDVIIEEYVDYQSGVPSNFKVEQEYRFTFEKQKDENRFIFRGVFKYDAQNSEYYRRRYIKVADETNLFDF